MLDMAAIERGWRGMLDMWMFEMGMLERGGCRGAVG